MSNAVIFNNEKFCPQGILGKVWRTFLLSQGQRMGVLLASSAWQPNMLLSCLQCRGWPPTTKNYMAQSINNVDKLLSLPRWMHSCGWQHVLQLSSFFMIPPTHPSTWLYPRLLCTWYSNLIPNLTPFLTPSQSTRPFTIAQESIYILTHATSLLI